MLSKPITFVIQIKALSDKENRLLRNEKWRVCQHINKFISGVYGCKGSDDVAKCESCLTTLNDAFSSRFVVIHRQQEKQPIYRRAYPEAVR